MKKFFIPIFIFIVALVNAQNNDGNNFNSYYTDHYANIVPKTPTASNFLQYGNTPVNSSSGLPSINIPIFTISEDGVDVPISLSYDASGVRVDELSSTVGLKWTLVAGGGVYRTVNDLDDFAGNGWTNGGAQSHFENWLQSHEGYDYSNAQNQEDLSSEQISSYDDFPDNFTYKFLDFSGSFMYDPSGDILMGNYNNKLQSISPSIAIDLSGNQYFFSIDPLDAETNTPTIVSYVEGEDSPSFNRSTNIVGWVLQQIVTKNQKTIDFEYITYNYIHPYALSSQRLVTAYGYDCDNGYPYGAEFEGSTVMRNSRMYGTNMTNNTVNKLISKVYTDNVEIKFIYEDGPVNGTTTVSNWDQRINKIIIKDKILNKQKEFLFKYGVFNGDPRLKLTEIQEKGFDNTLKPPYKFFYDESNTGLPEVESLSKDYKGFYNGKNNASLLPKTAYTLDRKIIYQFSGNLPVVDHPGYSKLSDRYFDQAFIKRGVLTSIEYPTKGKTEFIYEPNAIGENTSEPLLEMNFGNISTNPGYYHYTGQYGTPDSGYEVFNVLGRIEDFVGKIKFNSMNDCPFCYDEPNIDVPLLRVYEYDSNDENENIDINKRGDEILKGSLWNSSINNDKYLGFSDPQNIENYTFDGVYLIQLKIRSAIYDPNQFVNVNLEWNKKTTNSNGDIIYQKHYFGGLRIKEIKDIDHDNKVYNHTKYSYLEGYTPDPYDSELHDRTLGGQMILSENKIWEHGTQIANGYYYPEVEIEKIGTDSYGKTKEYYLPETTFYNLGPGNLYKKEVFDKDNNLLSIEETEYISSNLNDYEFSFLIPSSQDNPYGTQINCQVFPPNGPIYTWTWPKAGYHNNNPTNSYRGHWILPDSTKVTNFLKEGTNLTPVTTITTYEYNDNFLVTKEEIDTRKTRIVNPDNTISYNVTNTHGDQIVIETTYPDDDIYNGEPALFGVPVLYPVSKKVKNDGITVLGQFFEYNGTDIKASYKYHKGEGGHAGGPSYIPSNYERVASYLHDQGKPIQITQTDGISTAYIWDISKTFLLGQVVNASYAEISSYISNANLDMSDPNADTNIFNAIDSIRQGLQHAQVTSYLYNPLIGVKRITDPRGQNLYYNYDDLGRLLNIKDDSLNFIGTNKYHYKN